MASTTVEIRSQIPFPIKVLRRDAQGNERLGNLLDGYRRYVQEATPGETLIVKLACAPQWELSRITVGPLSQTCAIGMEALRSRPSGSQPIPVKLDLPVRDVALFTIDGNGQRQPLSARVGDTVSLQEGTLLEARGTRDNLPYCWLIITPKGQANVLGQTFTTGTGWGVAPQVGEVALFFDLALGQDNAWQPAAAPANPFYVVLHGDVGDLSTLLSSQFADIASPLRTPTGDVTRGATPSKPATLDQFLQQQPPAQGGRLKSAGPVLLKALAGPGTRVVFYENAGFKGTTFVPDDTGALPKNAKAHSINMEVTQTQAEAGIRVFTTLSEDYESDGKGDMRSVTRFRSTLVFPPTVQNVEISAWEDDTSIEVDGKTYSIGPMQPAKLSPNQAGRIVVRLTAEEAGAPELMVRTDTMPPGTVLMVYPDQEMHEKIASLPDNALRQSGMVQSKYTQEDCKQVQLALQSISQSMVHGHAETAAGVTSTRYIDASQMADAHWVLNLDSATGKVTYQAINEQEAARINATASKEVVKASQSLAQGFSLSKSFKKATKVVVSTGESAAKTVSNTANDAAKATAEAARKTQEAAEKAAQEAAKQAQEAARKAQEAEKAAQEAAAKAAAETARKAKEAEKAAQDAAAKAAAEAARKTQEAAEKAAKEAAKAAQDAAEKASKEAAKQAEAAAKAAASAANTAGDAIVDASKVVAKQLVVTVHFLEENVPGIQFVVNQAKHAAMAIKAVVEMIEVAVEKFVEWVRFIFEWKDIQQTQKVIINTVKSSLKGMSDGAIKLKNNLDNVIDQLKKAVEKAESTAAINSTSQASNPTGHGSTEKFEWFMNHLSKNSKDASAKSTADSAPKNAGAQFVADMKRAAGNLGQDLFGIEQSIERMGRAIADGDAGAAFIAAKDIACQLVTLGLDVVRAIIDILFDGLAALIDGVLSLLTTKIHIPYVSDLLKKFLGIGEMSMLDVGALILAIPVTIGTKLFTGQAPFKSVDSLALGVSRDIEVGKTIALGIVALVDGFMNAYNTLKATGATQAISEPEAAPGAMGPGKVLKLITGTVQFFGYMGASLIFNNQGAATAVYFASFMRALVQMKSFVLWGTPGFDQVEACADAGLGAIKVICGSIEAGTGSPLEGSVAILEGTGKIAVLGGFSKVPPVVATAMVAGVGSAWAASSLYFVRAGKL